MTPIIFVHQGTYDKLVQPLHIAVVQARQYNAARNIFIVADADCRAALPPMGVNILPLEDYVDQTLAQTYIHRSPNPYDYELFCLTRWFVLRSMMRAHNLQRAMHLDSDVMFYANADDEDERLGRPDLMHYNGLAAHSFWSIQALDQFCDGVLDAYRSPEWLLAHYEVIKDRGYGISDMIFVEKYASSSTLNVVNSCFAGPPIYDGNINLGWGFEEDGAGKIIEFRDHLPHGRRVADSDSVPIESTVTRFAALHFQGHFKDRMWKYLRPESGHEDIEVTLLRHMCAAGVNYEAQIALQRSQLHRAEEEAEALWKRVESETLSKKQFRRQLHSLEKKLTNMEKAVHHSMLELSSSRWLRWGARLRVSRAGKIIADMRKKLDSA